MHDNEEDEISSLIGSFLWGISSAGRASALHAEGDRFDPDILHQESKDSKALNGFCKFQLPLILIIKLHMRKWDGFMDDPGVVCAETVSHTEGLL